MISDEWLALRTRLREAGIAGVEDLGRFVSNTDFFRPSIFDERAAFDILLDALPTLDDPRLVSAVADHLRRPWARGRAFQPLATAFERWAHAEPLTAWHLADAAGTAATVHDVAQIVALARATEYGMARQMLVMALGRFRKSADADATRALTTDDDVALHARMAYRRIAGPVAALEQARRVCELRPGSRAAEQALRQIRKLEKATR